MNLETLLTHKQLVVQGAVMHHPYAIIEKEGKEFVYQQNERTGNYILIEHYPNNSHNKDVVRR